MDALLHAPRQKKKKKKKKNLWVTFTFIPHFQKNSLSEDISFRHQFHVTIHNAVSDSRRVTLTNVQISFLMKIIRNRSWSIPRVTVDIAGTTFPLREQPALFTVTEVRFLMTTSTENFLAGFSQWKQTSLVSQENRQKIINWSESNYALPESIFKRQTALERSLCTWECLCATGTQCGDTRQVTGCAVHCTLIESRSCETVSVLFVPSDVHFFIMPRQVFPDDSAVEQR